MALAGLHLALAARPGIADWVTYPGDYRTLLVSRADGADGAGAVRDSTEPSVSLDADYVGFASAAGDLGATGGGRQVFLRDVESGRTILVSRADGPHGAPADGDSFDPTISHDGNLVAFASTATNLGDGSSGRSAVYVRNVETGRTTLVSRSSAGAPADADAGEPSIAPGGDAVAFVSAAGNLGGPAPRGVPEVYERYLTGGRTVLVSRAPGRSGAAADAAATDPSVDEHGGRVAFQSAATDLGVATAPYRTSTCAT